MIIQGQSEPFVLSGVDSRCGSGTVNRTMVCIFKINT